MAKWKITEPNGSIYAGDQYSAYMLAKRLASQFFFMERQDEVDCLNSIVAGYRKNPDNYVADVGVYRIEVKRVED